MNLTAQRLKELLHYNAETGVFTRLAGKNKGLQAGSFDHGYWSVKVGPREYYAHRLAWLYMTGEWPTKKIDHIDCDPLNNRWVNLREASDIVNAQNIRRPQKNNSTGFLGVARKRKRFEARIYVAGKQIRAGIFNTPEEAHQAYVNAKRILHEGCTL